MSVFSEISDVLLLVVHSVISVVRGNNPNGSAYNCLEIYSVFLINMPITRTTWFLFFLLAKLECIQGFCCNWLPQGGAAGIVSLLASIDHTGISVFRGIGENSSLQPTYLHSSLPPSTNEMPQFSIV